MFERFTPAAREVVITARAAACARGDSSITTLHLLHALTTTTHDATAALLVAHGLDADTIWSHAHATDAQALGALGIDLERVIEQAEATFGPGVLSHQGGRSGHTPFEPAAKKVLEMSLREALARKDRHIGPEHILLALDREAGQAAVVLSTVGLTRARIEASLARAS